MHQDCAEAMEGQGTATGHSSAQQDGSLQSFERSQDRPTKGYDSLGSAFNLSKQHGSHSTEHLPGPTVKPQLGALAPSSARKALAPSKAVSYHKMELRRELR